MELEEAYKILGRVCRSITCNHKDLTQEVILKLLTNENLKDKVLSQSDDTVPLYLKVIAISTYRTNLRLNKEDPHEYITELSEEEPPNEYDPYNYILRIKNSNLDDIEKLWIFTYLEANGNYKHISRKIKVSRQTISKRINQAIDKL